MPPPFEEWWKGHIVLPLSVRPRPRWRQQLLLSFSGVSSLRLSFSSGASVSFGHISSFLCAYLQQRLAVISLQSVSDDTAKSVNLDLVHFVARLPRAVTSVIDQ